MPLKWRREPLLLLMNVTTKDDLALGPDQSVVSQGVPTLLLHIIVVNDKFGIGTAKVAIGMIDVIENEKLDATHRVHLLPHTTSTVDHIGNVRDHRHVTVVIRRGATKKMKTAEESHKGASLVLRRLRNLKSLLLQNLHLKARCYHQKVVSTSLLSKCGPCLNKCNKKVRQPKLTKSSCGSSFVNQSMESSTKSMSVTSRTSLLSSSPRISCEARVFLLEPSSRPRWPALPLLKYMLRSFQLLTRSYLMSCVLSFIASSHNSRKLTAAITS